MQVAAIIPVKTFSNAKSRLGLSQEKTSQLCKIMLERVLESISQSKTITKSILVSKDENAFEIGKRFNTVQIFEDSERGVNHAVSLADRYLVENGFDTSVVFPQDIPLMQPQDITNLIKFRTMKTSLLVVPSRKFDGTNALVRTPVDVIETHYDEDSYKIHLTTGKSRNISTSFVLISRIMWDVDNRSDLEFIMSNIEKQDLREQLQNILNG
ncbi:MAG: 2-phospho-L-lactate guanylyltransferase [Candidatus Nitrosotenuis sp.]|nr:MAG: 2-phospho-L-lactate guanylyltransferase [Candidatus Nitrosotenuis sp.]